MSDDAKDLTWGNTVCSDLHEGFTLADKGPICSTMSFHMDNTLLFSIEADGTIKRGPAFKTMDQASLEFWRILEGTGWLRAGKVPLDEVAKQMEPEPGSLSTAISAMHTRRRIDGR
jgi:hypothetical protein